MRLQKGVDDEAQATLELSGMPTKLVEAAFRHEVVLDARGIQRD